MTTIQPTTVIKSKKKKRPLESTVPSLYSGDLGIEGLKKKRITASYSMSSIKMSMKLTKEDVIKLNERKVSFDHHKVFFK
jgi:hypothetical protein